jgi:hypothetical protein
VPPDQTYRKLRIFVACPGDVTAEKDRLAKVVERLKKPANESGYFLELIEWRQVIGMGRPQQVIFDQADPQTWDIFVGVLWQRFGSPSGAKHPTKDLPLESGTHEEFLEAYGLWEKYGWPQIFIYRCIRVIVVTQLSRQPCTGSRAAEAGRPRLSDLWELGSLEQDADIVGLLVRPEYYEPAYEARMERGGEAELVITKQRNGPTGEVPLTFLAEFGRFESRARESQDA